MLHDRVYELKIAANFITVVISGNILNYAQFSKFSVVIWFWTSSSTARSTATNDEGFPSAFPFDSQPELTIFHYHFSNLSTWAISIVVGIIRSLCVRIFWMSAGFFFQNKFTEHMICNIMFSETEILTMVFCRPGQFDQTAQWKFSE